MNLQAEKLSLIEEFIGLTDKELIQKIKMLVKKSSKSTVKPMSIESFFAKIDASEKALKQGETISRQALEKEITTWKRKK